MKDRMLLTVLLIVLLLTSCVPTLLPNIRLGSGNIVSDTRTVSNFHTVTLTGLSDLAITQGATEALTIVADENIMPYIRSVVQDGNLTIGFDKTDWPLLPHPTQPIKFTLVLKKLDALTLAGQGNIEAANLKTPTLKLALAGQGAIRIANLEVNDLTCTVTGHGDIRISSLKATRSGCVVAGQGNLELAGQLTSQEITITSRGDYQAGNLDSQTAKVALDGTGNVTLWVRKRLEIEVFGKGTIAYYGNPVVIQNGLGAADVHSLGNK